MQDSAYPKYDFSCSGCYASSKNALFCENFRANDALLKEVEKSLREEGREKDASLVASIASSKDRGSIRVAPEMLSKLAESLSDDELSELSAQMLQVLTRFCIPHAHVSLLSSSSLALDYLFSAANDDGCPGQAASISSLGNLVVASSSSASTPPSFVSRLRDLLLAPSQSLFSTQLDKDARSAAAFTVACLCCGHSDPQLTHGHAETLIKALQHHALPSDEFVRFALCTAIFGAFRFPRSRNALLGSRLMDALERVPTQRSAGCIRNGVQHLLTHGGAPNKALGSFAKQVTFPISESDMMDPRASSSSSVPQVRFREEGAGRKLEENVPGRLSEDLQQIVEEVLGNTQSSTTSSSTTVARRISSPQAAVLASPPPVQPKEKEEESSSRGGSSRKSHHQETQDVSQLAPGNVWEKAKEPPALANVCSQCDLVIDGKCILISQRKSGFLVSHPSCFRCEECVKLGVDGSFSSLCWVQGTKLFCRNHFLEAEGFVCRACNVVVTDTIIRALGGMWHSEHFVCTTCRAPFQEGAYYRHENMPYCAKHIAERLGMNCAVCGESVSNGVKAIDKMYHEKCFCCTTCKQSFGKDGFYAIDGLPYCKEDAVKVKSKVPPCDKCGLPISKGVIINALDKRWHHDCFVCVTCGVNVAGGFYGSKAGPVCKDHRERALETCATCGESLKSGGSVISALGKKIHAKCFVCAVCNNPFDESGFYNVNGLPYCRKDAETFHKNAAIKK